VLKISQTQNDDASVKIRLCGQLTKEYLPEIERLLSEKPTATSIDLGNVTFVDREAMVFLCSARARSVLVENCPSYVTRWIQQERTCCPSDK
jgi:hypothetical protein